MLNRATKVLLYGSDLWYLGEGMLGPLFAVYAQKIGGNVFDLTWAWGAYLIVAGLNIILVGKLSDKFSKGKLMVLGYALNSLFTFCYIFVDSPTTLFTLQVGLGVAAAFATPTWEALYSKYQSKETSGFTWGLFSGEAKLVTGVAIIIGGFIVNSFSFIMLFLVMGLVQVVATVYQAKILSITKK